MMKQLLPLCAFALLCAACGGASDRNPDDATHASSDTSSKKDTAAAPAPVVKDGKRYGHKSGIITMKSSGIITATTTFYFDDYGEKMAAYNEIEHEAEGKKTTFRNVNLLDGESSILYDEANKLGMKMPDRDGMIYYFPDFDEMSQAGRDSIGYQKLESRTILGKECAGHALKRNQFPIRVWMWEGIPLRTELHGTAEPLVWEATSVEVDVPVAAEKFVLPAGIKMTEAKTPKIE